MLFDDDFIRKQFAQLSADHDQRKQKTVALYKALGLKGAIPVSLFASEPSIAALQSMPFGALLFVGELVKLGLDQVIMEAEEQHRAEKEDPSPTPL